MDIFERERSGEIISLDDPIYVYVPDVDAAYSKAMQLGATPISEPAEKPYQERQAGFRDSAGNTWWVSTYKTNA